jgi:hypothetical protein
MAEREKLKVKLNMDDLTFGELEEFERVTGMVMSDAVRTDIVRDNTGRPVPDPDDPQGRPLKETKMSAKAMMGMVYLALRKEDSEMTFDKVRALRLSDVDLDVRESEDEEEGKEEAENIS